MRLSRRLKNLGLNALDLAIILVEDTVESWSTGESRAGLQKKLRETADHAAMLALEKHTLEDELDKLRFNGPSLWKDEVDALVYCRGKVHGLPEAAVLANLMRRCDHMPMTAAEMDAQARGILDGTMTVMSWEELFARPEYVALPCDHKDDYGSMMLDGKCMGCGVSEPDHYPCPSDCEQHGVEEIIGTLEGSEDDDIPF